MKNMDSKLHILVCYEKSCAGETVATEQICSELARFKDVNLKTYSAPPLFKTDSLNYFFWIFKSITSWVGIVARNRNVNWIYTPTYTAGVIASLLKPISGAKICFHYHGSRMPDKPSGTNFLRYLTQWSKYTITRILHHLFLLNLDLIIVPSDYSKNLLKKQFSATKGKKIIVIPNGVDLKVFKERPFKTKLSLRKKYNIKRNAKVILAIGRLNKEKRVDLLFPVISLLKDKIPNILLLIAYPKEGTKDERIYKRKLKKQIMRLGISDYVLRLPGEKNIANIYAMSDLVVLASKKENFPLVMLEALASKVIFISTPVGGVKQILLDIDKRLVIKNTKPKALSKQLSSVLNFSNRQKNIIRQKGYKLAQQHSWKKTAKGLLASLNY